MAESGLEGAADVIVIALTFRALAPEIALRTADSLFDQHAEIRHCTIHSYTGCCINHLCVCDGVVLHTALVRAIVR